MSKLHSASYFLVFDRLLPVFSLTVCLLHFVTDIASCICTRDVTVGAPQPRWAREQRRELVPPYSVRFLFMLPPGRTFGQAARTIRELAHILEGPPHHKGPPPILLS